MNPPFEKATGDQYREGRPVQRRMDEKKESVWWIRCTKREGGAGRLPCLRGEYRHPQRLRADQPEGMRVCPHPTPPTVSPFRKIRAGTEDPIRPQLLSLERMITDRILHEIGLDDSAVCWQAVSEQAFGLRLLT
jgi:hypothetical protein